MVEIMDLKQEGALLKLLLVGLLEGNNKTDPRLQLGLRKVLILSCQGLSSEVLNQGDSVYICINSSSYSKASISGIATLSYSAALIGGETWSMASLLAVSLSTSSPRSLFLQETIVFGSQCFVKMQLHGNFSPPNGFMNVSITGKASSTMDLGGHRVPINFTPGDCSLQKETSQSGFLMDVEASAFDTSTEYQH